MFCHKTSEYTKEFLSLIIPEWKNEYVDYTLIRKMIKDIEEERNLLVKRDKMEIIIKNDLYQEIHKVNAFYLRMEERYTKRHGELYQELQKWRAEKEPSLKIKNTLILAYQEHYKALNYLNNFKILNHAAIIRLFTKLENEGYEKAHKIMESVDRQKFWTSKTVDFMIKDVEQIFQRGLFPNNQKIAMDKLNITRNEYYRTQRVLRSGIFLGMCILMTILNVFYHFTYYIPLTLDYGANSLGLFRILFYPNFMLILIAVNLFICSSNYINYVFIFGLDPTTRISKYQFLEVRECNLISIDCMWIISYMVGSLLFLCFFCYKKL